LSDRNKSRGVSEKHGTLRTIATANFIFSLIFMIFSLPFFWHQAVVLLRWPETTAQVIRSDVVTGTEGHDNVYRAKLQVLYTVGGQPQTPELTSFESRNYAATLERVQQYPVGSQKVVRYDPDHPEQARIGAGWSATFFALPLLVGGMALFFACVGAIFLAIAKAV
jgi:hypothetical protein